MLSFLNGKNTNDEKGKKVVVATTTATASSSAASAAAVVHTTMRDERNRCNNGGQQEQQQQQQQQRTTSTATNVKNGNNKNSNNKDESGTASTMSSSTTLSSSSQKKQRQQRQHQRQKLLVSSSQRVYQQRQQQQQLPQPQPQTQQLSQPQPQPQQLQSSHTLPPAVASSFQQSNQCTTVTATTTSNPMQPPPQDNNNTNNTNNNEDQTIPHLENECNKLSLAMSKLRKYSSEWFYLESKLANAKEELEAAREDLDLHCYLDVSGVVPAEVGGGGGGGGAMMVNASCEVPTSREEEEVGSVVRRRASDDDVDDDDDDTMNNEEEDDGGIGVPETVFLAGLEEQQQKEKETEAATTTTVTIVSGKGKGEEEEQSRMKTIKPRLLLLDHLINTKSSINSNSHHNEEEEEGGTTTTMNEEFLHREYQRINAELKAVPKFTPEWFALKEELVELSITLHDGGDDDYDVDKVDSSQSQVKGKRQDAVVVTAAAVEVANNSFRESSGSNNNHHSSNKGTMENKSSLEKQKNQLPNKKPPTSPFKFRPIIASSSPRSPLPRSPSPIPTTTSPRSSSPPYHNNNSNHCLSPYQSASPASSRRSTSSRRSSYSRNMLMMGGGGGGGGGGGECYDYDSDDDDDDDTNNTQISIIANLREEYTTATNKLNTLPQFSKEWFDLKTRTVGLEDQIEELEYNSSRYHGSSSSNGGCGGSVGNDGSISTTTTNINNRSTMSGWSSHSGWSSAWSEDEVMSYADDLECVMVAEALKRGGHHQQHAHHQRTPSSLYGSSEDEAEIDDELLLMQPILNDGNDSDDNDDRHGLEQEVQLSKKEHGITAAFRSSAVMIIQACVRGRHQLRTYNRQRQKATVIQSWVRKSNATARYRHVIISIVRIQRAWKRHYHHVKNMTVAQQIQRAYRRHAKKKTFQQQQQQDEDANAKEEENTIEKVDAMLDEFALMLASSNEQQDDEKIMEKEHYYSTMIQERWRNYRTCRPFVCMRRWMVLHHCLFGDNNKEQQQQGMSHHPDEQQHYSQWQILSVVLIQGRWRGYHAWNHVQHVKSCAVKIQSLVRCRQQRQQYLCLRDKAIVIQSVLRKEVASSKFRRVVYSIKIIQCFWRKVLLCIAEAAAAEAAAAEAAAVPAAAPKKTEYDSIFDEMEGLLGDEAEDEFDKQMYNASIIQEQWYNYKCCKALVSMRRRAVQYHHVLNQQQGENNSNFDTFAVVLLQAHWRQYTLQRDYQSVKLGVVGLQSMIRSKRQRKWYNQQCEMALVIQSFLRTYWLANGQVYTDQREVFFHSTALGIKLQRGKDGFVRVLSVAEAEEATTVLNYGTATAVIGDGESSSSIVRNGKVAAGDLVMEAAGVNLRSPITKSQWGDTVGRVRHASRPMKFVVACGSRRGKTQLLDECEYVSLQLTSLLSVVMIQRVWREHCSRKRTREENLRASIVIQSRIRQWLARCLYERELENAALLADCEAMLMQLHMLQGAAVIQSYARQWLAHSSFCRKRQSSIRIQAYLRMESQRSRYRQTLTNAILIQAVVRGWIVRKNPPDTHSNESSPSRNKLEEQVVALSMELSQMQEFTPEWTETADRLHAKQEELRRARETESRHDTEYSRSEELKENNSPEREESDGNAFSFSSLREKLENRIQSVTNAAAPKRTKSNSPVPPPPVTSQAQEQQDPQARSPEIEHGHLSSVASLRQSLEAKASSTPLFPQTELSPIKKVPAAADSSQHHQPTVPVPEARGGEMWSPENELRNISNVANYKKNMESNSEMKVSVRSTTPAESTQSSSSAGKKKRSGRNKRKKKLSPEEKMRKLSTECISLSQRIKSLPKFSPEWTLSKIEMNLVTEELEFLYAESMNKGARV